MADNNIFADIKPDKPFTDEQIKANKHGAELMAWYYGLKPLHQLKWPRPDIKGPKQ